MKDSPHFYWTPRSGGTFVWQVLHRVIPVHDTGHSFIDTNRPLIINYRDPRDILASYLRIHFGKYDENRNLIYSPPTQKQIDTKIETVQANFRTLYQYRDFYVSKKDILWLRYEDYIDDINILFGKIENFMGLKIPQERRAEVKQETSKVKNIDISKKVSHWRTDAGVEFDHFDMNSRIHIFHIYDGAHKGWRNYISKQHHEYINRELKKEIEDWGYKTE